MGFLSRIFGRIDFEGAVSAITADDTRTLRACRHWADDEKWFEQSSAAASRSTVLHFACAMGRRECLNVLLSYCPPALLAKRDSRGRNVLVVAIQQQHHECVETLLRYVRDHEGAFECLMQQDTLRCSVFHHAAEFGNAEVYALLSKTCDACLENDWAARLLLTESAETLSPLLRALLTNAPVYLSMLRTLGIESNDIEQVRALISREQVTRKLNVLLSKGTAESLALCTAMYDDVLDGVLQGMRCFSKNDPLERVMRRLARNSSTREDFLFLQACLRHEIPRVSHDKFCSFVPAVQMCLSGQLLCCGVEAMRVLCDAMYEADVPLSWCLNALAIGAFMTSDQEQHERGMCVLHELLSHPIARHLIDSPESSDEAEVDPVGSYLSRIVNNNIGNFEQRRQAIADLFARFHWLCSSLTIKDFDAENTERNDALCMDTQRAVQQICEEASDALSSYLVEDCVATVLAFCVDTTVHRTES
ncbi:MAG: hypothetical protein MHM6MM_002452 [Cercozoa sp. M6MM]